MKVEVKIDEGYVEPEIVIYTSVINSDIEKIINKLIELPSSNNLLFGIKNQVIKMIDPDSLINIYCHNTKVFAVCDDGEYLLKLRLYELEEKFLNNYLIRISNSEIINLKKVKHFDFSFSGTLIVEFINGKKTSVSRRYMSKIKKILNI